MTHGITLLQYYITGVTQLELHLAGILEDRKSLCLSFQTDLQKLQIMTNYIVLFQTTRQLELQFS